MIVKFLDKSGNEKWGRVVYHTPVSVVIVSRETTYRIPVENIIRTDKGMWQILFLNIVTVGIIIYFIKWWAILFIVMIFAYQKIINRSWA